jgi:trigger factor
MATPQTIAGFAEGVLGAGVGETRDVKVTFPADYGHKEYASKEAVFSVTVKEIKEKKLPALDDEFAKDLGLTSLAELQQKMRENMEKEETARADKEVEEQLFTALLEKNDFPVPPTLVQERVKTITQRALNNLLRQGLVQQGDQQALKTVEEKSRPQAERDVRLSYLIKAISAQESLEAGDADVETLKAKALEENKDKADAVEKYFRENAASIRASLTEGKVMDFLKNNAKVKTAKE